MKRQYGPSIVKAKAIGSFEIRMKEMCRDFGYYGYSIAHSNALAKLSTLIAASVRFLRPLALSSSFDDTSPLASSLW